MRKLLFIVLSTVTLIFLSCTEYKARQAEKQRIQDSIYVARQDSIKRAKERQIFVQDSIKREKEKQQHIRDSIRRVQRINDVKHSVKITEAKLHSPNSAGGVDVEVNFKNLSDKTIKYFVWEGYPLNAVGDRVGCEIRGMGNFRGKVTGPIKPKQTYYGYWSCAWYCWSARELVITGIEITYMDGTRFDIKRDEIKYVWNKK